MSDLQPRSDFQPVMRSPLHHFGLVERQASMHNGCGVWANEKSLLGYISLRGNSNLPAFLTKVNAALGVALPTQPCTIQAADWGSILWISPDEWLIVCERAQRQPLQQALETALSGIHSQVVDNSGGYTWVALQGTRIVDLLRHCTVYDVENLTAGHVVGSTFGKLSTFIVRNHEGFHLVLRRSFADYIWRYLERSAAPYGFGIAAKITAKI